MIDREMQLSILQSAFAVYPAQCPISGVDDAETSKIIANIAYLQEHGLCQCKFLQEMGGEVFQYGGVQITAKGIDFLADDGGLSAILGIVTIKLHADSVREIIEARIASSGLPTEQQSILRKHLSQLPATALQEGMKQLARLGVERVPNLVEWLQTLAGL